MKLKQQEPRQLHIRAHSPSAHQQRYTCATRPSVLTVRGFLYHTGYHSCCHHQFALCIFQRTGLWTVLAVAYDGYPVTPGRLLEFDTRFVPFASILERFRSRAQKQRNSDVVLAMRAPANETEVNVDGTAHWVCYQEAKTEVKTEAKTEVKTETYAPKHSRTAPETPNKSKKMKVRG